MVKIEIGSAIFYKENQTIMRRTYTIDLLSEYCQQHNIKLAKDYDNVGSETRIEFYCPQCSELTDRDMRNMLKNKSGSLCLKCTKKRNVENSKATNIEKYGVDNPLKNKDIRKKIVETCQVRYGGKAPACSEKVREKMKETMTENYQVENPMKNDELKAKQRQSLMDNYGVENPMKHNEIRKKAQDTLENRTGKRHPLQDPDILKKAQQTCFENYGVDHPLQNKDVLQKAQKTCLENYGVRQPLKNSWVLQNMWDNNASKWGVCFPLQVQDFEEKRKATCQDRYECEYPLQNENIRKKWVEYVREKYGYDYVFQNEKVKQKIDEKQIKLYGSKRVMMSPTICQIIHQKREKTCLLRYGSKSVFGNKILRDYMTDKIREKYGVGNVMQNAEIAERNSKSNYKKKEYIFADGTTRLVQGYEVHALRDLEKLYPGLCSTDYITDRRDVPNIWYNGIDNKRHRHYVDIYIPTLNTCIEVKSPFTYEKGSHNLPLKKQSGINMGYDYKIWMYQQIKNNVFERVKEF